LGWLWEFDGDQEIEGVFIMQERVVRDQWECPKKMEQHFPIKPGHPKGMAVTLFVFLFRIPYIIEET